jgi:hypothetical protein
MSTVLLLTLLEALRTTNLVDGLVALVLLARSVIHIWGILLGLLGLLSVRRIVG